MIGIAPGQLVLVVWEEGTRWSLWRRAHDSNDHHHQLATDRAVGSQQYRGERVAVRIRPKGRDLYLLPTTPQIEMALLHRVLPGLRVAVREARKNAKPI